MKELVNFIKTSKKLVSILEGGLPKDGREDYIENIHKLLDDREQILHTLPNLSEALDEDVKQELIKLEDKIKGLLSEQQLIIKKDLQVLQLKKQKSNQYANPYENVSADGMFLDKKK